MSKYYPTSFYANAFVEYCKENNYKVGLGQYRDVAFYAGMKLWLKEQGCEYSPWANGERFKWTNSGDQTLFVLRWMK
jgi:hypothetical protein